MITGIDSLISMIPDKCFGCIGVEQTGTAERFRSHGVAQQREKGPAEPLMRGNVQSGLFPVQNRVRQFALIMVFFRISF